jgi:hypothetical protein
MGGGGNHAYGRLSMGSTQTLRLFLKQEPQRADPQDSAGFPAQPAQVADPARTRTGGERSADSGQSARSGPGCAACADAKAFPSHRRVQSPNSWER